MLVVKPSRRVQFLTAVSKLVSASRMIDGVINYDICETTTEPNTFIAIVQFENEDAMHRQGEKAFAPVSAMMNSTLAKPIEGTIFDVAKTTTLEA